jgi:predicted Zn-dependent peptidase
MSSRLFHEVREKRGLAYSIGAGSEEYLDCGYLVAQGGFRIPSVDDALKIVLEQFDSLKIEFVTEEELNRAKDYWRGKMVLALEDSYRVASFYTGKEVLLNYTSTPEEVLEKVSRVTKEDIKRVANNLFKSENLNLAAIGPFKEEDRFDRILQLD